MQTILIINPKGGCGKSTISTQLSGYYASWKMRVAIADMDPQKSSLNWLRRRPVDANSVIGINAVKNQIEVPDNLDHLIIDTAAGLRENDLRYLSRLCDSIIIPVLPSSMDTHAASQFVYQLLIKYRLTFEDKNICIVANRAKMHSVVYRVLLKFLETLKLPLITTLRESRHYLESTANGETIFDPSKNDLTPLIKDWLPLLDWLNKNEQKKRNETTEHSSL